MTKRINNPLPYPYSQYFKKEPTVKNLNCLEDDSEQISSGTNFAFIILIVLILFNFRKPLKAASYSDTDLNTNSNIEANSDNYYE